MYVLGTVCCRHIYQSRSRHWVCSVLCVQSILDLATPKWMFAESIEICGLNPPFQQNLMSEQIWPFSCCNKKDPTTKDLKILLQPLQVSRAKMNVNGDNCLRWSSSILCCWLDVQAQDRLHLLLGGPLLVLFQHLVAPVYVPVVRLGQARAVGPARAWLQVLPVFLASPVQQRRKYFWS